MSVKPKPEAERLSFCPADGREEAKSIPSKGWAEMIRKVFEVDPMICSKCGGPIKVVAFITDSQAVDRIIDHLKLTFTAEKPPPEAVL